jgi:hypothetical protein
MSNDSKILMALSLEFFNKNITLLKEKKRTRAITRKGKRDDW